MRGLPASLLAAVAISACMVATAEASHPPVAPRDPYGEAKRPDQVVLSWRAGDDSGEPERYLVFRDGEQVGEADTPRFVDEWLLEGTRYEYAVRAERGGRLSPDSAVAPITTPPSRAFEIGPYLQQLTPTGAAVVWQTYEPATTVLRFGLASIRPATLVRGSRASE